MLIKESYFASLVGKAFRRFGKLAFPLGALYHGTKFAVEGISESLSFEVEEFGGKVKIVEPGAIATDFTSRSLDFKNDETLAEYQPLVAKTLAAVQNMFSNASPASVVAGVIYEAAADGTNQFRYIAGEDAKQAIASRKAADDATFSAGLKVQLGL